MLPVSTVFGRFTRLVRDVARSEGKRVRLVATGGETLLDKTVLDRLGEPLVHLLTNAIVHGIEPEARARSPRVSRPRRRWCFGRRRSPTGS